jgi:hypothetical protein
VSAYAGSSKNLRDLKEGSPDALAAAKILRAISTVMLHHGPSCHVRERRFIELITSKHILKAYREGAR